MKVASNRSFDQSPAMSFAVDAVIAASRHEYLGRIVPRGLLYPLLLRGKRRFFDAEIDGVKMRLHPFDNRIEKRLLLRPQKYSRGEKRFLAKVLADGGVYVDIGANVGALLLPFARIPGLRILAIEPAPVAVGRLRQNIAANSFDNVEIIEAALSDAEGEIELSVRTDDIKLSRVGSPNGDDRCEAHKVRAATLLSILKERAVDSIAAVKIDVEGHEDRVLLPFFDAAQRSLWPRAALVEVMRRDERVPACIATMKERGYQVAFESNQNIGLVLTG